MRSFFRWGIAVAAVLALACSPDDAPQQGIAGTGKKLYSQFDEELIIRDFFRDRPDGVFLDVGSAHPKEFSTTYYLEKHLGWSGIAVDALASYAPAYEQHRPRTRFFSYIVTDHGGTLDKFFVVHAAPGLSSTIEDRTFRGTDLQQEEIRVPTITLDRLLDEAGVDRIDFLSMDIELGAPKALNGFDIRRFRPELVCIESGRREDGSRDEEYNRRLIMWFDEHGYGRIERYDAFDDVNWYFTPRS